MVKNWSIHLRVKLRRIGNLGSGWLLASQAARDAEHLPVRLTMKASSTILSLKTFAKYCSSALSERYMGGMFLSQLGQTKLQLLVLAALLTRMVFARGKGISFNHWYRRSVKCSYA